VQKLREKEIKEIKKKRESANDLRWMRASEQLSLVRSMHALYPDSYRAKTETCL
jgi:hypothetical protein